MREAAGRAAAEAAGYAAGPQYEWEEWEEENGSMLLIKVEKMNTKEPFQS
ncbi:MAG TPA: hypothetical protein VFW38_01180 [Solirubrobacteraceae bacterium]|nr:hypothetical protein [Solirubrobacteraceae bacterium]